VKTRTWSAAALAALLWSASLGYFSFVLVRWLPLWDNPLALKVAITFAAELPAAAIAAGALAVVRGRQRSGWTSILTASVASIVLLTAFAALVFTFHPEYESHGPVEELTVTLAIAAAAATALAAFTRRRCLARTASSTDDGVPD
jgi:peptidoglycan/LPS O-acetylase OafA/YrhL